MINVDGVELARVCPECKGGGSSTIWYPTPAGRRKMVCEECNGNGVIFTADGVALRTFVRMCINEKSYTPFFEISGD